MESLPHELNSKILEDLPLYDVARICQINHYFYEFCNDELFWRKRLERRI